MDHFNMEPLNGTALVTDDRVDVWMPTQHPQNSLYVAADETGILPENVHVHQPWVGTGLGRRVYGDDTRMVVAIANKMRGTPVKVIWTREESMRQGRYRDLVGATLTATLGEDGLPKALYVNHAASRPVARNLGDTPYQTAIPNFRVQTQRFNTNLMTGPWRGPVFNSNCFILETFINELAETAKIDPIEYRRKLPTTKTRPGSSCSTSWRRNPAGEPTRDAASPKVSPSGTGAWATTRTARRCLSLERRWRPW
jgi:isoquinoline 1-oxidoreductase subunit beta